MNLKHIHLFIPLNCQSMIVIVGIPMIQGVTCVKKNIRRMYRKSDEWPFIPTTKEEFIKYSIKTKIIKFFLHHIIHHFRHCRFSLWASYTLWINCVPWNKLLFVNQFFDAINDLPFHHKMTSYRQPIEKTSIASLISSTHL